MKFGQLLTGFIMLSAILCTVLVSLHDTHNSVLVIWDLGGTTETVAY